MLKLKGVDFWNAFIASGTLNFFGQGWLPHKFYRYIPGFSFNNATFIAKTATCDYNKGHLELDGNLQPIHLFPDCVKSYFLKGTVLNAVGLSNHGMRSLLQMGKWQKLAENFFISIMEISETKTERLNEMRTIVNLLGNEFFSAKYGLEINFCPNMEQGAKKIAKETVAMLKIASELGVPIIVKVDLLTNIGFIKEVADSGLADAFSCTNSIKWGALSDKINWKKIFGNDISPLAKYGGGAMSGKYLLPLLVEWIYKTKGQADVTLIAGGGILHKRDVKLLKEAGADAIALASTAIIRPHRVQGIIDYANALYS